MSTSKKVSEEDLQLADKRKRKRMISNRESARRSRMRKQQQLDDLINQMSQLKIENSQISMQINLLGQNYMKLESENTLLRTHMMGLAERLQSLNSILRFYEEPGGMGMGESIMPDALLEPWQLSGLAQQFMAPTDIFQC